MAKKERKSRKKISKKVDITKPILPIDILKFGTDEDPCFGKLHDLTEDACKRCGDSTLCAIVCDQVTKGLRQEAESNNRFKDLEIDKPNVDEKEIKKFIKTKLKEGTISLVITKKVVQKYKLTKEEAKKLVRKYKK